MKFNGIQSLRGFAASIVLLHHLDVLIAKDKYFGEAIFGPLAASGFRGVDLFFVISGFIMMHSSRTHPNRTHLDFISKRAFRIFIPYLPIFFILTSFYIAVPSIAQGRIKIDEWFIIQNLFLLPREVLVTYVPVVAWTLSFELTFYIIFALTILKTGRLGAGIFIAWMALCFANIGNYSLLMILNPLNLGFGVGVVSYLGLHYVPKTNLLFGVACLTFLSLMMIGSQPEDSALINITFLLVSGLMCVTSAQVPRNLFSCIGDFSYSLYLCHYPIMALLFIVTFKLMSNTNPYILSTVAILISFSGSWIYYRLVELYLSNVLKSKMHSIKGWVTCLYLSPH